MEQNEITTVEDAYIENPGEFGSMLNDSQIDFAWYRQAGTEDKTDLPFDQDWGTVFNSLESGDLRIAEGQYEEVHIGNDPNIDPDAEEAISFDFVLEYENNATDASDVIEGVSSDRATETMYFSGFHSKDFLPYDFK